MYPILFLASGHACFLLNRTGHNNMQNSHSSHRIFPWRTECYLHHNTAWYYPVSDINDSSPSREYTYFLMFLLFDIPVLYFRKTRIPYLFPQTISICIVLREYFGCNSPEWKTGMSNCHTETDSFLQHSKMTYYSEDVPICWQENKL